MYSVYVHIESVSSYTDVDSYRERYGLENSPSDGDKIQGVPYRRQSFTNSSCHQDKGICVIRWKSKTE